ncbi:MAG TPA: tetratricopeptide repeat protein [Streptosporangiaceae bacterium]|nr:tetratricopeptide repeat protein [Streptosporangiaceae bacterium]
MAEGLASFAGLLRHLRDSAGLTQEEFAERARVGVNTISELERGLHQKCQVQTARRLATALGLSGASEQSFIAAARGLIPATAVLNAATPDGSAQASAATFGHSAASPAVPAAPAAPEVRYSLPTDTAAFTGREEEITRITAAVRGASGGGGVVTIGAIDGMPGVGKTALAVHVAHALAGQFPDRQLFIDLHGHTPGQQPVTAEDALAGLLAAIGVDARNLPGDLAGRAGLWRDRMTGQKALLVLDNAASSGQVAPLLPGTGGCLVLVNSRRHLGDLPGMVIPVLVDVLPPQDAASMFTRLAPRTAGDAEGVAQVVALAGHLPLAISLLARVFARHPSWTLADLAAETRAGVLTLAAETDSVAAAFEVSYRHLGPDLQRLFRLLGVHPGTTIDAYAATALVGVQLAKAAGLLDSLHAEGLLTEVSHRRYGMHDLIRRYAQDLAAADQTADSCQAVNRLLDYYEHTAAIAGTLLARQNRARPPAAVTAVPAVVPGLPDRERALAWARAERGNLLACLDHATGAGQHARVVALTAAVTTLLRNDGHWVDAITRHATAAQAARRLGDRYGEADAQTDLGSARRLTCDYPGAAEAAQEALGIYRDLGDRQGEGNALTELGTVRRLTGDYPGAAEAAQEALGIYRDLGDRTGQGNALRQLGAVRWLTGDYPGAAEALGATLDIYRDLGDRTGQAAALGELGVARRLTGDYRGAAEANREALGIYRDLGHRKGEAAALGELGVVRRLTGDYPGGVEAGEEALGIYRDLGDRFGQATALGELAAVRRLTGDYPAAAAAVEEALNIMRDLGDRGNETAMLNEAATLHLVRGDLNQAIACYRQALHLAREIGSSHNEAEALAGLGRCALAAGDAASAKDSLRLAHQIFQKIGAADASEVAAELDSLSRTGPSEGER